MKPNELNEILSAYDAKLDRILSLNSASIQKINLQKTKKKTQTVLIFRSIEVVIFSALLLFLGSYIANHWFSTHLAVSGGILFVFTLIALIGSIGQVALLNQIDYSKPVVEIRKKIERVNTHVLLFVKLLFLSGPVWWAYSLVAIDVFLDTDLYVHLDPDFVQRYLIINGVLIFPLLWFLNKLSFKNLHLKWVRTIISWVTGTKTQQALTSLKQIEEFEN
ncbi:hypothetical protein ZORO111903_07565 [Zobellia roscoffensis]|uniref:hypothetical protein n=1 Tax=Zobellia roscoffensis TaxID=2779508 RepID=UPI00188C64B8|nr:hypothetical protein [Zobellia roscoffensis]